VLKQNQLNNIANPYATMECHGVRYVTAIVSQDVAQRALRMARLALLSLVLSFSGLEKAMES
jgi:hypothetical protein